jgi:hypothetical protein
MPAIPLRLALALTFTLTLTTTATLIGFAPTSLAAADAVTAVANEPVVEVFFVNGDSVRGVVVSKTAETLVLHVVAEKKGTRISADRSFPMSQIKLIATLADEYRMRTTNTPNAPVEQAELARWCYEHGLHEEAQGHALKSLDIEPVNRDALGTMRHLGLIQLEGTWQNIDTWLTSKGLVRYEGLAMDEATRQQLITLNQKRTADATALSEAKQAVETLTNLNASAKTRVEKIDKSRAEANTAEATAGSRQKAVDAAKQAVATASKRVEEAGKSTASGNQSQEQQKRAAAAAATARDNAEAARKKANEALAAAQKELAAADPATVKARKARLEADLTKAKADLEKSAAELTPLQASIATKQAAAEASAKAYADARAAVQQPADLPPAVRDFLAADLAPKN